MRKKLILIILATVFFAFVGQADAAAKFSFIQNLLRHSDDVAKYGKRADKITIKQMEAVSKRFPELAGKSKDFVRGAVAIEQAVQKSPAAARLIDKGLNPASIARVADLHPERVKLGGEIAEMFSNARPAQIPAGVPQQALEAAKSLDGNYVKAAEKFFEMTRKGGKKAVIIAQKLYEAATPGKVAAASAAALLAWHIVDPQGAEESVEGFFRDHVAPMVEAPVKGMIEGGGKALDNTLDTAKAQAGNIVEKHWGWLISGVIVFLLFCIPNLRRLPFAIIDKYCGSLLNKIQPPTSGSPSASGQSLTTSQQSGSKRRINIYGKK